MKTNRPTFRDVDTPPVKPRTSPNTSVSGNDDSRFSAESDPLSAAAQPTQKQRHLGRNLLLKLLDELSDRDHEILDSLRQTKYLMTGQVQRLHFTDSTTHTAAIRATAKAMRKLKEYGLVDTFERRIGGVRAGSASYVWHLTEAGQRLLNIRGQAETKQRSHRYLEPSYAHLTHTLAISECYVMLEELSRQREDITLTAIQWEPDCWRSYTKNGKNLQLKPDLFAVTKNGQYEDSWFIEVDLNTEPIDILINKCKRYYDYFQTGIEQKQRGVFPLTLWVVPDLMRRQNLSTAISKKLKGAAKMFLVIVPEELMRIVQQVG